MHEHKSKWRKKEKIQYRINNATGKAKLCAGEVVMQTKILITSTSAQKRRHSHWGLQCGNTQLVARSDNIVCGTDVRGDGGGSSAQVEVLIW